MSLTINILVKNKEETIGETVKQAKNLSKDILVGDIGSSDRTVEICENLGARVIPVPFKGSLSDSKNYMIERNKNNWIMFLEPGERVVSMPKDFNDKLGDKEASYRIKVIRGDLITKDLRIWHRSNQIKFKNPIFETAVGSDNVRNIDLFVASDGNRFEEESVKALNEWKLRNPMSSEPMYYYSCLHLIKRNWRSFINSAETYLYGDDGSNRAASLMTRYYLSMVKSYIQSEADFEGSIRYLLSCIAEKPLMAEFWCLLGDIYYRTADYSKSESFYENATILGSRRVDDDDLPIEISKYKEYPLKMIEACREVKKNMVNYKKN